MTVNSPTLTIPVDCALRHLAAAAHAFADGRLTFDQFESDLRLLLEADGSIKGDADRIYHLACHWDLDQGAEYGETSRRALADAAEQLATAS